MSGLSQDLRVELLRDRSGSDEHFVRVFYCGGTQGKGMPWAASQVLG